MSRTEREPEGLWAQGGGVVTTVIGHCHELRQRHGAGYGSVRRKWALVTQTWRLLPKDKCRFTGKKGGKKQYCQSVPEKIEQQMGNQNKNSDPDVPESHIIWGLRWQHKSKNCGISQSINHIFKARGHKISVRLIDAELALAS